jgi:hypothetical protein
VRVGISIVREVGAASGISIVREVGAASGISIVREVGAASRRKVRICIRIVGLFGPSHRFWG